jgi:biotin carboxyl carrier protein
VLLTMASIATACRLSSRLLGRKLAQDGARRGMSVPPQQLKKMPLTLLAAFQTSMAIRAAQNFTMPALSPTMTEGNIATWRVKEGDKFVAGDVLLEIETDKATMDVEAQEDGIMMKIMQGDGAKGVQVGTRIAVLAEEGDDISALDIPPDENLKQPQPEAAKQESAPAKDDSKSEPDKTFSAPKSSSSHQKQTYPLLPSVLQLIKQNGLDESVAGEMTPTGPNGRLLKGDVLAYLGTVKANIPAEISARYEKLTHLDLSNIKAAKAPEKKMAEKAADEPPPEIIGVEISLPVSLEAVVKVQKKIQDTLGVFLPLSTFISRATDVANDDLPISRTAPTADELFDQVLGLDQLGPTTSQGVFFPEIRAIQSPSMMVPHLRETEADIIDILAGNASGSTSPMVAVPGISAGLNEFSLIVPQTDEKRATVFLERIKTVLETEPGRLVL